VTIKAIFFDVGNTLLFLDWQRIFASLGYAPSREQLCAAERVAKLQLDADCIAAGRPNSTYWQTYFTTLLRQLGLADESQIPTLRALACTSSSWRIPAAGVHEVLPRLKQQYRLGVISNADGEVEGILRECGLAGYFDSVIDSGRLGVEKPDARIFRAALDSFAIKPDEAAYIGDVYSVDFLGARNAGLQAVLMDSSRVYPDHAPRVESLAEFERWLMQLT
jgi:HAD superfamily hydrolase (TIGR01509 family)